MSGAHSLKMPLILIGAGGHAKVLLALAQALGHSIIGVCDPALVASRSTTWRGLTVLGDDTVLENYNPGDFGVINGIGQLVGSMARRDVYERIKRLHFFFPPLIHPTAWVDPSSILSEGVQIMAGVVIQAECSIGENTIVNTKVSIDHDCLIGSHVHLAPGATLCGGVSTEDASFVAAGATVVHGIHIGRRAVVGAGTCLRRNLFDDLVFVG